MNYYKCTCGKVHSTSQGKNRCIIRHLAAAAPAMLAALEAVRWAIEDGTLIDKDRDPEGNDMFRIVDSAIAKAGGQ